MRSFVFSRHSARGFASSFPVSQEVELYEGLVLPIVLSTYSKDLTEAGWELSQCSAKRGVDEMVTRAYTELQAGKFNKVYDEARTDMSTNRTIFTCTNIRNYMRPTPPLVAVLTTDPTTLTYNFNSIDTLLESDLSLSIPSSEQDDIIAHSPLQVNVRANAAALIEQLFLSVQDKIVVIDPETLPDVLNDDYQLSTFYQNLYNYASLIEMSAVQGPPLNVIFKDTRRFRMQKELVQKSVYYIDTAILLEHADPIGAYYSELWIDYMNSKTENRTRFLVTHEERILLFLHSMGFVNESIPNDINIYPLHSICVAFHESGVCVTAMKPRLFENGRLGPSFDVYTIWKGTLQEYNERAQIVADMISYPLNPLYEPVRVNWIKE